MRGLPPNLGAEEFKTHFSQKFITTDAKLIPKRRIGYVGYKSPEDAAKAVKYYNKSFICMSRIGVELARSVGEQLALRSGANGTNGLKRKHGNIKSDANKEDILSGQEKHKNEVTRPGEEKSKLQEFLKVMQPPSKSKSWEDSANPLQVPTKPGTETEAVFQESISVISHEDNKPVIKKQKRCLENTPRVEKANVSMESEKDSHTDTDIPKSSEEMVAPAAAFTTQAESDVDWLRSRTSRLLGLVDDEDALQNTALSDSNQIHQDIASIDPPEAVDSAVASSESENMAGEATDNIRARTTSSNEVEEMINNNRRLFIRNLTYSTTEDDLRHLFEDGSYGVIEEVSFDLILSFAKPLRCILMMNILIGTAYVMHMMLLGRVF